MKKKCPECGMTIRKGIGNYRYKESGLDNVWLENLPVYQCSCKVVSASIFQLRRLHELIGRRLVEKPALLNGKEIRFLRKSIYLSSKAFSKRLGVGKTTLSKWENGSQQHSASHDRLIRETYMILKGFSREDSASVLERLAGIRLKKPDIHMLLIAEKVKRDYRINWRLVVEGSAEDVLKVWGTPYSGSGASAIWPSQIVFGWSQTESDLEFSSNEPIRTKAEQYPMSP